MHTTRKRLGRVAAVATGSAVVATCGIAAAVGIAPASATAPEVPAAAVAERQVTVASVTDGDTFDTADGQRVRVLGINSCESDTAGGGRATAQARQLLAGQSVTLATEPGVDTDRYDRQLRYVQLPDGQDYGLAMVAADHTGIYGGDNDAAPAYLDRLRAADNGVRSCN